MAKFSPNELTKGLFSSKRQEVCYLLLQAAPRIRLAVCKHKVEKFLNHASNVFISIKPWKKLEKESQKLNKIKETGKLEDKNR